MLAKVASSSDLSTISSTNSVKLRLELPSCLRCIPTDSKNPSGFKYKIFLCRFGILQVSRNTNLLLPSTIEVISALLRFAGCSLCV